MSVDVVVRQHVEDAGFMALLRGRRVVAPQFDLAHLGRFDSILEAHLDGLSAAGDLAWSVAVESAEELGVLATSTFTHIARGPLGHGLPQRVARQLCGDAAALRIFEETCLLAEAPYRTLPRGVEHSSTAELLGRIAVRMRSPVDGPDRAQWVRLCDELRTLGDALHVELLASAGAADRMSEVVAEIALTPAARRAAVAGAAALLGDRRASIVELEAISASGPGLGAREACVLLDSVDVPHARDVLKRINERAGVSRELVRACGFAGDSFYVPWLVRQMDDLELTRLAGESFSMITGLDLAWLDLDRKPPENFESGPNDDPNDPNVDMDEDDGLPWPDQEKIAAWWKANSHRFPAGQRFFMGQPPSMAHCLEVLKSGYQRQRMAAAIWRCILQPGTPLFPTDAPAWRQKRWLAQMTA